MMKKIGVIVNKVAFMLRFIKMNVEQASGQQKVLKPRASSCTQAHPSIHQSSEPSESLLGSEGSLSQPGHC